MIQSQETFQEACSGKLGHVTDKESGGDNSNKGGHQSDHDKFEELISSLLSDS